MTEHVFSINSGLPMSAQPCQDECEHLIRIAHAMADALSNATAQKQSAPLDAWLRRATALLDHAKLESIDGEQALENLALDLRRRWLGETHTGSNRYMMSPPHAQVKSMADGQRIHYPYDRWLKPNLLEQRLAAHRRPPQGWIGRSLLFANGMSAITTTLQLYRSLAPKLWPRSKKSPLALHWFGGYFEIARALKLLCDDHLHGRKHANQTTLCEIVTRGAADLILIEPVAADIDLDVFDLDAFITAWRQRRVKRPCAIIIDASLSADTFPVDRLCQELADDPPAMIVSIRSALKLDQEGLELANGGLIDLWVSNTPDNTERLDNFEYDLAQARTTLGVSLSQDEYAALSAPFFLDQTSLTTHAGAVFANNRRFAETLSQSIKPDIGLLARISHPSLSPANGQPWAEAPFVNLSYRSDQESARAFLRAVLEHEATARKLSFRSGSSFGFRAHRFEMGFVRGVKFNSLRIAIGARRGPSLDGLIELFQELAAYPDFGALRKAYPKIEAQHPKDRVQDET